MSSPGVMSVKSQEPHWLECLDGDMSSASSHDTSEDFNSEDEKVNNNIASNFVTRTI